MNLVTASIIAVAIIGLGGGVLMIGIALFTSFMDERK